MHSPATEITISGYEPHQLSLQHFYMSVDCPPVYPAVTWSTQLAGGVGGLDIRTWMRQFMPVRYDAQSWGAKLREQDRDITENR